MDSTILIPALIVLALIILAGAKVTRWYLGTAAIQKELAASRTELAAIRALLEKAAY